MGKNTLLKCTLLILASIAVLAPTRDATAMTAEQYFEDGNRLFRDDLYWAALLRYRQAADEGLDSSILHYNTGVAHYRARQHIRARQSLLKALDDPPRVIILTLADHPAYQEQAKEAGADGLLSKYEVTNRLIPMIVDLFG